MLQFCVYFSNGCFKHQLEIYFWSKMMFHQVRELDFEHPLKTSDYFWQVWVEGPWFHKEILKRYKTHWGDGRPGKQHGQILLSCIMLVNTFGHNTWKIRSVHIFWCTHTYIYIYIDQPHLISITQYGRVCFIFCNFHTTKWVGFSPLGILLTSRTWVLLKFSSLCLEIYKLDLPPRPQDVNPPGLLHF